MRSNYILQKRLFLSLSSKQCPTWSEEKLSRISCRENSVCCHVQDTSKPLPLLEKKKNLQWKKRKKERSSKTRIRLLCENETQIFVQTQLTFFCVLSDKGKHSLWSEHWNRKHVPDATAQPATKFWAFQSQANFLLVHSTVSKLWLHSLWVRIKTEVMVFKVSSLWSQPNVSDVSYTLSGTCHNSWRDFISWDQATFKITLQKAFSFYVWLHGSKG